MGEADDQFAAIVTGLPPARRHRFGAFTGASTDRGRRDPGLPPCLIAPLTTRPQRCALRRGFRVDSTVEVRIIWDKFGE